MRYVWAAFSFTWIAIFVYTLLLARRQARLAEEVRLLLREMKGQ